jgi:hypothetical protein
MGNYGDVAKNKKTLKQKVYSDNSTKPVMPILGVWRR